MAKKTRCLGKVARYRESKKKQGVPGGSKFLARLLNGIESLRIWFRNTKWVRHCASTALCLVQLSKRVNDLGKVEDGLAGKGRDLSHSASGQAQLGGARA